MGEVKAIFQENSFSQDFSGGPMVKRLSFLIRELRSHMPCGMAKKVKTRIAFVSNEEYFIWSPLMFLIICAPHDFILCN